MQIRNMTSLAEGGCEDLDVVTMTGKGREADMMERRRTDVFMGRRPDGRETRAETRGGVDAENMVSDRHELEGRSGV